MENYYRSLNAIHSDDHTYVSDTNSCLNNLRLPCDGAGRGYFDDNYLRSGIIVLTDKVKEPLLYMGGIK